MKRDIFLHFIFPCVLWSADAGLWSKVMSKSSPGCYVSNGTHGVSGGKGETGEGEDGWGGICRPGPSTPSPFHQDRVHSPSPKPHIANQIQRTGSSSNLEKEKESAKPFSLCHLAEITFFCCFIRPQTLSLVLVVELLDYSVRCFPILSHIRC